MLDAIVDEAQVELYVDQRTFVMSRGRVKINWKKMLLPIYSSQYIFSEPWRDRDGLQLRGTRQAGILRAGAGFMQFIFKKTQNNNIIVICKIAIIVIVV